MRPGVPKGVVGGIDRVTVSFSGMTEDGAKGNALNYLDYLIAPDEEWTYEITDEQVSQDTLGAWEVVLTAEFNPPSE